MAKNLLLGFAAGVRGVDRDCRLLRRRILFRREETMKRGK